MELFKLNVENFRPLAFSNLVKIGFLYKKKNTFCSTVVYVCLKYLSYILIANTTFDSCKIYSKTKNYSNRTNLN